MDGQLGQSGTKHLTDYVAGWFDEHYLNVQAKGLILSTINITAQ
jgi:hypothetical protein